MTVRAIAEITSSGSELQASVRKGGNAAGEYLQRGSWCVSCGERAQRREEARRREVALDDIGKSRGESCEFREEEPVRVCSPRVAEVLPTDE